jgi:hypothetical protein
LKIKEIKCPECECTGWPGSTFQSSRRSDSDLIFLRCKCGAGFSVPYAEELDALSPNLFCRLSVLSNHYERGEIHIKPGNTLTVKFDKNFDFTFAAFFTPFGPIHIKELSLQNDHMVVISSILESDFYSPYKTATDLVVVGWNVYGLRGIDKFPPSHFLFISALKNMIDGSYKSALLDYAASFEIFIEETLHRQLTMLHGEKMAEFLLSKHKGIETRIEQILPLALTGNIKLDAEIYKDWKNHIQTPRNKLAHGKLFNVDRDQADNAHQTVYQAMKWIDKHN